MIANNRASSATALPVSSPVSTSSISATGNSEGKPALINSIKRVENGKSDITFNKNPQLDKAREILDTIKNHFKQSDFRSSSKLNLRRPYDAHVASYKKLLALRDTGLIREKEILKIAEKRAANCGEMARLAYAMCYKHDLKPIQGSWFRNEGKEFDHAVCQIDIDNEKYIMDPWANILCKKEDYIEQIASKLEKWKQKDKYMLADVECSSPEEFIAIIKKAYNKKGFMKKITLTPKDIRKAVFSTYQYGWQRNPTVLDKNFYDSLESLLAVKNEQVNQQD